MPPDEGSAQMFCYASVCTVVFFGAPHSARVVCVRELVAPALRPAHMSVVDPAIKAIPVAFGDPDVADRSGVVMQGIDAMVARQCIEAYGIAGREAPEDNVRVEVRCHEFTCRGTCRLGI